MLMFLQTTDTSKVDICFFFHGKVDQHQLFQWWPKPCVFNGKVDHLQEIQIHVQISINHNKHIFLLENGPEKMDQDEWRRQYNDRKAPEQLLTVPRGETVCWTAVAKV